MYIVVELLVFVVMEVLVFVVKKVEILVKETERLSVYIDVRQMKKM